MCVYTLYLSPLSLNTYLTQKRPDHKSKETGALAKACYARRGRSVHLRDCLHIVARNHSRDFKQN
jgi:regulator of extracellular matrix RemA (YlzA/DUF370 family)